MLIVIVRPIITHGNNKKFSQISTDSMDSQCTVNPWSQQKFLNLEVLNFEVLKAVAKYVKHDILNVWFWSTIQEQALSLLVSQDPYCCLSIKKLFWFNFLVDFTDMKLVLTCKNGKPSFHMLMIEILFNQPTN